MIEATQQRIRLSTKKGKIGYRIVKFQIMSQNPVTTSGEHIMKIYKVPGYGITTEVDFADGNLLATALFIHNDNYSNTQTHIIFDKEIFNQDIYITHQTGAGDDPCNYYIELEMETLSDNAASVSTLRDIRLNPQVGA
jgi:hypothetical protein